MPFSPEWFTCLFREWSGPGFTLFGLWEWEVKAQNSTSLGPILGRSPQDNESSRSIVYNCWDGYKKG